MKKILSLLLCTFGISASYAQKTISLPFSSNYDENALILTGIQYSYVNSNYRLSLKEGWQQMSTNFGPDNINNLGEFKAIQAGLGHGVSVGIPIDVRFNENVYASFTPIFVFFNGSRILYTDDAGQSLERKLIHGTNITKGENFNTFEFPLSIKFKSDEKILKNKSNRYRTYLLGGLKYSRFLSIDKEYKEIMSMVSMKPEPLIVKPSFISWEAGLGVEIYFTYFKMSPELKFSQSLSSILDHHNVLAQDNQFMAPLDKAFLRNIKFSIIFQ